MPSRFQKATGGDAAAIQLAAGFDPAAMRDTGGFGIDWTRASTPARTAYYEQYQPQQEQLRGATDVMGGGMRDISQYQQQRDAAIAKLGHVPAMRSGYQTAGNQLAARMARSNIGAGQSGIYEGAMAGLESQWGERLANAQLQANQMLADAQAGAYQQEMGARGQEFGAAAAYQQALQNQINNLYAQGKAEEAGIIEAYRAASATMMGGEAMRQGEGGGSPWGAFGSALGTMGGTILAGGNPMGGMAGGQLGGWLGGMGDYGNPAGAQGYNPYYAAGFQGMQ